MSGHVRWVPAYLLANVTPVLASTAMWVVVIALQPVTVLVAPMVGVVAVLLRHTSWVLAVRYGVRRATAEEQAIVFAALVGARSLRGRGQPRVWAGGDPDAVRALSPRDLAIGEHALSCLAAGHLDPQAVARSAVYALAPWRLGGSTVRGLVAAYCLPWTLTGRLGTTILEVTGLRPLWALGWMLMRPVLCVIAVWQHVEASAWGLVVATTVFAVLTYTTPAATRHWRLTLRRVQWAALDRDALVRT